ncbi:protein ALTERED PHOSPHATE STARVATION RESPONSE 1-like [Wolffia australiana]
MGGCAASKLGVGDEDEAVATCRERKRLIKSAVERRCALADAHSRYVHSLYSVAGAVSLFVARHSSPAHFLITLPSSSAVSEPSFLRQTPSEPKTETAVFRWSRSPSSSSSSSSAEEAAAVPSKAVDYGCFYADNPPPAPSPMRSFGWDFFDPFDGVMTETAPPSGTLHQSSEEDLRAVREEEGIPELEEEGLQGDGECLAERIKRGKKLVNCEKKPVEETAENGLAVVEETDKGRELLDALKDVVDLFIKAYDSGREVSRMLEANTLDPHAGVVEENNKKENSSKLVQAITWHRSPSSQSSSSSFKSLIASSSRDVSSVDGRASSCLFDDYGGMASGSHSLTLQRLYAWEKKLYEEVKAGDRVRRIYERKCTQLTTNNAKGVDSRAADKTKSAAKDLYTRILVTLRSVETMSERIQKLRDEELEPQLVELIKGLTETWRTMVEAHESQNRIMVQVKAFTSPAYGKFSTHLHRNATVQLLAEVQSWRACFQCYLVAQREYVEAVHGWLAKFLGPELGLAPGLVVLCRDWLAAVQRLPEAQVGDAMKSLARDLRALCRKQEEEQNQKRRVDAQAKELDKTEVSLQRAENRILEPKLSEAKAETDVWHRVEGLAEKKERIQAARDRLEAEKWKHRECMQATQRAALDGLRTGLANVFHSLADFSRDSLELYSSLASVVKEDIPCR